MEKTITKKPNNIKQVIDALDENLKKLNEAEEINLVDIKEFLIELIGTIRDMWERFYTFFNMVEEAKKIQDNNVLKISKKNIDKSMYS